MASFEEISNEQLISLVEVRPAIYNKESIDYTDQDVKSRLWEEIAARVIPNSWKEMTLDQKDKAIRDIQKRWKNLRGCFARELRLRKRGELRKRRKYLYFNKMKFLLPHTDPELTANFTESTIRDEVDNDSNKDEDFDIQEGSIVTQDIKEEGHSKNSFFDTEESEKNENSTINTDPDVNFALSLVPWLKAVPFRNKLEAQIALLNTLKNFVQEDEKISEDFAKNTTVTVKTEVFDEFGDVDDL